MQIKNRKNAYKGFHSIDILTISHNGDELEREQYKTKNAVAALVYDTEKKVYMLVEQYRVGAEKKLLEIVAGHVDKSDPDHETAIRREVLEETGYAVDSLTYIADFYTTPGTATEIIYLYYAEVSRKEGEGGGVAEENEDISLKEFTARELLQETLNDSKTLIAVLWLKSSGKLASLPKD